MVKNRLKEIRMREYLMNMKEFAEVLDINYRQYTEYEKGVIPKIETIFKIAKKLNRSIEEIFYMED